MRTQRGHRFRGPVVGLVLALSAQVCVSCTAEALPTPSPSTGQSTTPSATSASPATGTGLILPDASSATVSPSGTSGAAPAAAWPQAPRLSWLGGARDKDGIRIPFAGGTRWQGRTPGEFALLASNGYQWFGADGSMVGCTTALACVGFAADGTIAITPGPTAPAAVYDVRGDYVGDFHADGRTSAPSPAPPSLAEALTRSGVDVSALVDAGTARWPFAGGATGDPHLVTAGGVRFTTQLTGQYVARGGDPAHAIQLEFEPMQHHRDVALVGAVAVDTGHDVIEVAMSGDILIDKEKRAPGSTFDQVTLDAGVVVGIWPRDGNRVATVAVVWPDGATVVATANPVLGMTVVAHLPRLPSTVGLFGAGAASGSSDLVARGGLSLDTAAVVTSWQASRSELLFSAAVDPLTGFPDSTATVPTGAVPDADAACRAAGIEEVEDRTACVFDTGLTGDDGFIAGHRLLAVPAEARVPTSAAWALWPALLPGTTTSSSLPPGGAVDITLDAGHSTTYRLTVPAGGGVSLVHQRGCASTAGPGIGAAALRLFDATGHPVSQRMALCGHENVTDLPAGSYALVLAAASDATTRVRVDVTVGA